jgi:phosphate transport system permease protein
MKSKTNQFEKSRFRRDYFFSVVVTVFGALVLAIFATLILHILTNALPLLQSPKSEKIHFITSDFASSSIGSMQLQGEWINISVSECSLYLTSSERADQPTAESKAINNNNLKHRVIKKFAPNCAKQIVGLGGEKNQHVLMLTNKNVLEIYFLESKDSLFLKSSLVLPNEFTQANIRSWRTYLSDDKLFIQRTIKTPANPANIVTLAHSLSSLDAPSVRLYEGAEYLLPLTKFNQVLVATQNQLRMYNSQMVVVQAWSLVGNNNGDFARVNDSDTSISADTSARDINASIIDSSHISALVMSQSSLDIFVRINVYEDSQSASRESKVSAIKDVFIKKFTLVNNDGDFLLRQTLSITMPTALGFGELFSAFDLRHNAGIFVAEYGHFVLMNIVTGNIKLTQTFDSPIKSISYAQGQLQLTYDKVFELYQLKHLQGMTSMQILFGKNDYAGYENEEYLWQTSVSSESQSPKYSVIPLVMGSLKASMLALIVALPLALGAAIYTAYFAPPHIRNAIKPSIEMLEAIPSVVIGFIAAVWLAPFAEQYLISIFSVIILLPFVVLVIAAIHGFLQSKIADKKLDSWQLPINAILLFFAVAFIFLLSLLITDWSNNNGYNSLVESASNLTLSKTAIVVSLALGVAIAPTIYTLIDDALFEVPEGVKQASFALGATKVQTLMKVVLVVAFPSIVSAIMLGFGRAFGETMIVLMVTGNTPIANWDLLSGLRTLTSNLAIELQEAPVDSTPYHILFLTAAILFAFTFVVNSVAALLKRRLDNYGR